MSDELAIAESAIRRKATEMPWNDPQDGRPWAARFLDFIYTTKQTAEATRNRRMQQERKGKA